jgi:tetratricopeptide (TPR) repeat protein
MKGYTTRDIAGLLGLAPHRIRAYARTGLLDARKSPRGEYHFSFQDLVLLRTAKGLADARVPDRRIRRALERLKAQLPRGRPLSEVRITAEGDEVVVRDDRTAWEPASGQMVLDFTVAELAGDVAPLVRAFPTGGRAAENDYGADDWYDLAVDLEVHDIDQAMAAYARALQLAPDHADAHVNLGRLLHERGRVAEAESHYRRALAIAPSHATAWFDLGVVLEDAGRGTEAISAYRQALRLDASLADAHYNLAGLYERAGDTAAALRHLQSYRALVGHKRRG